MAKVHYFVMLIVAIILIFTIRDSTIGHTTAVCNQYIVDEVELGADLADEFDNELSRNDICLFEGSVHLQDSSDARELLVLNHKGKDLGPATALTANKEYDDVVLEVDKSSVKLYYVFDTSIDLTEASSDAPLETTFLGKSLKIARVSSAGSFSAYVGEEYQLYVGTSVVVEDKTIKLEKIGESGAIIVSVDGETDLLSRGSTKKVNGIEITNVESFYESGNTSNNLAELIIGAEALLTIRDGDPYLSNANWTWNIGDLTTEASTTTSTTAEFSGPYIGIENYVDTSASKIREEGECVVLPNNYISICYNGTESADYVDFEVDTDTIDLTAFGGGSSESAVHFKTSSNELRVGARTNEAWIVGSDLYYDDDGSLAQASFDGTNVGTIQKLSITKSGNQYTIASKVANDDIVFTYSSSLGSVEWNGRNVKNDDGKLITRYGIVISDADNELELKIPDSQVKAIISIVSKST